ncbi:hypothetical protein BT93_L3532 [Corymbia citriodora subsp. variegata]|uniref:Uncharacterized protein n=1 Tax=Corymbia citriodora subsp. variegata TaxID=360336 RepID=A0A8T0CHG7_CORYI|nr:hypothetical protein BT93_L3532 [Corymbia citriodora subsp. variegata]
MRTHQTTVSQNQNPDFLGLHGLVDTTRIYSNITKESTRCRVNSLYTATYAKFSPRRLCR